MLKKIKKTIVLAGMLIALCSLFSNSVQACDNSKNVCMKCTGKSCAVQKYGASSTKKKSTNVRKKTKKVSKKVRNNYFSKSAFVGNSVSVGLKMYFNSQGKGFLGSPVMLVQGCYSFLNDSASHSQYQITYRGGKYKAKDVIKASGVKRVFISMGTNDLWKPASQTYKDYVQYVKGIRKKSPKVVIFIQGTTPMCSSRNGRYLSNSAINELNSKMKKYCQRHKDMYYIDVSKGLRDSFGGLNPKYASDGYVHLTMAAYKIWTNNVIKYVDNLILQEQDAVNAVKKAAKSRLAPDYQKAKVLVDKLENSTKKDELKKKLKKFHIIEEEQEEK